MLMHSTWKECELNEVPESHRPSGLPGRISYGPISEPPGLFRWDSMAASVGHSPRPTFGVWQALATLEAAGGDALAGSDQHQPRRRDPEQPEEDGADIQSVVTAHSDSSLAR